MMPFTVQRMGYGAMYFVRRKYAFGTFYRDLNDQERKNRASNKGAIVTLVVNDTPAFKADILVGDIIESLDDDAIAGANSLNELIGKHRGTAVAIHIDRDGTKLIKSVTLNP